MTTVATRNTLRSVSSALRKADKPHTMHKWHVSVPCPAGEYRITEEEGLLAVFYVPDDGAPARLGRAGTEGRAIWAILEHRRTND